MSNDDRPTAMEHMIADLVDRLKNDENNTVGIFNAIRSTMERARWLEKNNESLAKENAKFRNALSMPMPKFDNKMAIEYMPMDDVKRFIWQLKTCGFMTLLKENYNKDPKFWRQVRWISYRAFCKHLRSQFDENFERFMSEHLKYK